MADGNSRSKKRRAKNKQDTAVAVQGVSADAIGDSSGGDVETRHDAGDQPTQDSPLKAARKLLSEMVQRIRKILRLDPR